MKYCLLAASVFVLNGCANSNDGENTAGDTTNGGTGTAASDGSVTSSDNTSDGDTTSSDGTTLNGGTTTGIGSTTSDGTTSSVGSTTSGFTDSGGCSGDLPVNVEGYLRYGDTNPMLLERFSEQGASNRHRYEFVTGPVANSDFIIGLGASYNLSDVPWRLAQNSGKRSLQTRSVCAPAARVSVGPDLTSLEITSNAAFGSEYAAGSVLNDSISILTLAKASDDAAFPPSQAFVFRSINADTEFIDLNDWIASEPMAPIALYIRLNAAPDSGVEHIFSLTYTLSTGISGTTQTAAVVFQ